MIKSWWRRTRPSVYYWPIYLLARLVGSTLRIQAVNYKNSLDVPGGKVFLGWHGRTFSAATLFRNQGFWTIISHSNDGRLQSRIFKRFGFNLIRGSSGDSGVRAAVESIRILKKGETMAFTPDGPLGPSEVVQPGVIFMAKKSGAAIIPVGVSAKWRLLIPSWDKYMIPLPFSKVVMIFGDPIWVCKDADDEVARLKIEQKMLELQVKAESQMGHLLC